MAENTDSAGPAGAPTTSVEAPASATASTAKQTTRRATARKQATKRSASTRSGAAQRATGRSATNGRARSRGAATPRTAGTSRRESIPGGIGAVGSYAERAVLIPVGAALIARERLLDSVSDVISSYSTPKKTQDQLHRFERRGVSARDRVERQARKTRVRIERELRRRKQGLNKTAGKVQDRIISLV